MTRGRSFCLVPHGTENGSLSQDDPPIKPTTTARGATLPCPSTSGGANDRCAENDSRKVQRITTVPCPMEFESVLRQFNRDGTLNPLFDEFAARITHIALPGGN